MAAGPILPLSDCRLTIRSSGRGQRARLASLGSGLGAPLSS